MVPPGADDVAAGVLAALRARNRDRAATLFGAWANPPPAEGLLFALLLDRPECVAKLLPAVTEAALADAAVRLDLPDAEALAGALFRLASSPSEGEAVPSEPSTQEQLRTHIASRLLAGGQPQLAEALLLPAWRGNDSSALTARALSGIWMVLGLPAEALTAARIAGEVAPQQREIQEHLAGLLLQAGEAGPALFAAGKALGVDPKAHQAWRVASSALLELGHAAEAIAAANRAAGLAATHAPHAELIRTAHAAEVVATPRQPTARAAPLPDWARPPARLPVPPPVRLGPALAARWRVVQALILRDTRTQYSNSRLGYAWALVEPMSHIVLLLVVFSILSANARPPIGDTMIEFYMTGVLTFLFFSHLTERAMGLVEGNRHMMQIPSIGLFDLIAGKALLSVSTDLVVAALTVSLLVMLGVGAIPDGFRDILLAYGALFLLGIGFVLINVVASAFSAAYEKVWPTFLRIQYFTSGVFYHPSNMPEDVRAYILLNPLVHVTEWMRQGYYAHYESPFLDVDYLMRWILGTLLFGIMLLAATAQRVRRYD